MSEPERPSPQFGRARLVSDRKSRILALGDALATGDRRAAGAVFADVARALGVHVIAERTGISEAAIFDALADPDRPDLNLLRRVAARLLEADAGPPA